MGNLIREEFEATTKQKAVCFPCCHADECYPTWEYVKWLEDKVAVTQGRPYEELRDKGLEDG